MRRIPRPPRNDYKVWYDYDGDGNSIYTWKGSHAIKNEYDALARLTKSSIRHEKVGHFEPKS
jgi:hypothetical protein